MPPINFLNPPPHPFWDFVAGIEDHPFFAGSGRPPRFDWGPNMNPGGQPFNPPPPPPPPHPHPAATQQPGAEPGEQARDQQPSTVEDPPEVDPSTLRPNPDAGTSPEDGRDVPFRGRGRFATAAFNDDGAPPRRGPGCGGRGRGGHYGPPPFMFAPYGPFGARRGQPPSPPGPDGPEHHGRGGRAHPHPGPDGGHRHGPRPGSPIHHGRPRPGHPGFDLRQFLTRLGDRLGIDLAGAAEELGVYRFGTGNADVDFEPRTDIFDTDTNYTIHLSLPGAKKEDIGVDWDGEHSTLKIAGVVHRPGVDEKMLSQLAVDGRKRETGVFEKSIKLGTEREPASVDVAGITAKMSDGILVVKVPKVEVEHHMREVPISGSATPSPPHHAEDSRERDITLLDADQDMYDADSAAEPAPEPAPEAISDAKGKEKEEEYQREKDAERDDRSETVGHDEQLPRYEAEKPTEESDWEKDGSEDEGEYVKINVD